MFGRNNVWRIFVYKWVCVCVCVRVRVRVRVRVCARDDVWNTILNTNYVLRLIEHITFHELLSICLWNHLPQQFVRLHIATCCTSCSTTKSTSHHGLSDNVVSAQSFTLPFNAAEATMSASVELWMAFLVNATFRNFANTSSWNPAENQSHWDDNH